MTISKKDILTAVRSETVKDVRHHIEQFIKENPDSTVRDIVNIRDHDDYTLLHLTLFHPNKSDAAEILQYLISEGAIVNATYIGSKGEKRTPLDTAEDHWTGNSEVTQRVLRAAGGKRGRDLGGCFGLFALLAVGLTAGICGLALFVTGML